MHSGTAVSFDAQNLLELSHGVNVFDPAAQDDPMGHALHSVEPTVSEYLPAAHGAQSTKPSSEKVPVEQSLSCPLLHSFPGEHRFVAELDSFSIPSGSVVTFALPSGQYTPGALHGYGSAAPLGQKYPRGHATQSFAPEMFA